MQAVTAIETNPQFLQLQNTVKVLQAKLEKQKELNKSLEQHKSRDSSPLRKSHDSSPQRKLRDLSPQRKSRDSSPQRKLRDLSPQCESHDSSPKAGRKGLLKPPLSGVDRESLIDRKVLAYCMKYIGGLYIKAQNHGIFTALYDIS